MLRESMHAGGKEVNVRGVTAGFDDAVDIPHAAQLIEWVEAVVSHDGSRIAAARSALRPLLGVLNAHATEPSATPVAVPRRQRLRAAARTHDGGR